MASGKHSRTALAAVAFSKGEANPSLAESPHGQFRDSADRRRRALLHGPRSLTIWKRRARLLRDADPRGAPSRLPWP